MVLTPDISTNFPAGGAGYTFDAAAVEFVAPGIARLLGAAGVSTKNVMTPNIDRTAWGAPVPDIFNIALTQTDRAAYYHRVAVSYDNAVTWETFEGGVWRFLTIQNAADPTADPLDATEVQTFGMPRERFERLNHWRNSDNIRFIVNMTREVAGSTGDIDLMTINHGTTITAFTGNPGALDTLAFDPEEVNMRYVGPSASVRMSSGDERTVSQATNLRRVYSLIFRPLDAANKDTLEAFLTAHQTIPFEWTPPGDATPLRFFPEEPTLQRLSAQAWAVRVDLIQNFAGEFSSL